MTTTAYFFGTGSSVDRDLKNSWFTPTNADADDNEELSDTDQPGCSAWWPGMFRRYFLPILPALAWQYGIGGSPLGR